MIFSYNWLQSFFEKKLPEPEKLAEILNLHSFEVKEINKKNKDYLLNIDVLPNRGSDCFSHLGIAREISAILNKKLLGLEINFREDTQTKIKDFLSVKVQKTTDCLRYSARVLLNVKVEPSPLWLRSKLEACGIKPINNIVDIANFVMLETGQPLHVFDLDKISGSFPKRIFVKRAKKGEKILALDDQVYELNEKILTISDSKNALAIAGIKGGKKAEINQNTKNIFIESANFNSKLIRVASKLLDLKTDASLRFEHGLDPNLTSFALDRATFLIQKIAKGRVVEGMIDHYPKKILPKRISFNFQKAESIIGMKIAPETIIKIFNRLQFKIKSKSKVFLELEIPTFRRDINIEEDLVEEVVRLYGPNKIKPVFPLSAFSPPKENLESLWEEKVTNILKELRMHEVYNYSFVSENDKEIFKFKNLIEVQNPTSSEFKYLRPSLIPNLLKNVYLNQKYFSEIRIFELGKVFLEKEKKMLGGIILGEAFLEMKGVIDLLFEKLGLANLWYDSYEPKTNFQFWHPFRVAEVKIDNEKIGILGEILPKILKKIGIEKRVTAFEIDFEKLATLASEEFIYQPPSPYPAIIRDLSVLVPKKTLVEEVIQEIENEAGEALSDVDLFDIYESDELGEDKKSLTFRLIFQKRDAPISPEKVDECFKNIINRLQSHLDWEVRK